MLTCKEGIYTITYKLQIREPTPGKSFERRVADAIFFLGTIQTL